MSKSVVADLEFAWRELHMPRVDAALAELDAAATFLRRCVADLEAGDATPDEIAARIETELALPPPATTEGEPE